MDRRVYPDETELARHTFDRGRPITVEFDNKKYRAYEGEPLAVALFASGVHVLSRSIKYHRPRTFFCLEGHCGACLVRIDGVPNLKSCQTPCRDGMISSGQNAFPASDLDLFAAADWMFSRGFDHHTFMTGSSTLNKMMQKAVRHLSGLGHKSDVSVDELPEVIKKTPDVVVVGAGPAGLAAATAAAIAGAHTLCIDEQDALGGSLLCHPDHGVAEAKRRVANARAAGVQFLLQSPAIAWFPEDDGGLLGVASPGGFCRVKATCSVYATGGYDTNALFENNDRPGVFSARAVGRLVVRFGIRPGKRVVVLGAGPYALALAKKLEDVSVKTIRIDGEREKIVSARGRNWVTGVDVVDQDGKKRNVACDVVAVAVMPAPASELLRQHGAQVELCEEGGGFAVLTDEDGRTSQPGVFACGDTCGFVGIENATAIGERTGRVAAEEARGS